MHGTHAEPGLCPRVVDCLFQRIALEQESGGETSFICSASLMQVYNEQVHMHASVQ